MDRYWIDSEWLPALEQTHLTDLVSLLMYTEGTCLSMHTRGSTFRSTLSNGQTVFIKRDHYTMFKDVVAQACHLQLPVAKSIREWKVLTRLHSLDFRVPQVIAAGWRTRLGRPTAAGIIMLPLSGIPLEDYLEEDHADEEKRQVLQKALQELARLQEAGVCWPDCKPEHFFLMPDGGIGLLDLERATFQRRPLKSAAREKQRLFFLRRLSHKGQQLLA